MEIYIKKIDPDLNDDNKEKTATCAIPNVTRKQNSVSSIAYINGNEENGN